MDARGNPTPGDTQLDPSTGAWTMYNGGSYIQVADGYDVSSMDYDPATGNVFDGKQWFGGGVPGYGSGDGSGYQASEGQESPTPEASQAPATPEASQGAGGQAAADQSVPATGPSDAPYGGSTNIDSAGKVMELGDAGSVDPVNGQVWNGKSWYNDPAVQVDPSTPVGAPVSYYVPDSFQWNGTSYVAEGNPGGAGQQQPSQGGNQEAGNQQQQQRAGNQGGRQYAAPGQQNPDGTWGPQVASAAGPFAGAVASTVSPPRPVQQQAPQQQAPQQQSWQPPQPTGPQQSYQSAGAAGAQQQQQQQQQTAPQQTAGPQVGPQKTSPQKTAAAQAGRKSGPPAKSNKGLLLFGVVAGLAVVTGIAVWASRPKTPVDPKVANKPAQPRGHQTAAQEHPAHAQGAA